jgi:hypothetical protein
LIGPQFVPDLKFSRIEFKLKTATVKGHAIFLIPFYPISGTTINRRSLQRPTVIKIETFSCVGATLISSYIF